MSKIKTIILSLIMTTFLGSALIMPVFAANNSVCGEGWEYKDNLNSPSECDSIMTKNNKEFAKEQDHAANAYKCVGKVLCMSSAAKIHEEKKISSKSVSGGLIFEYIFNPLLISLNWLLAWLVRFLTYCCNAMMSVAFDMPSALLDTWAILRTFANVLFVGLLVAFASMVIIGAKKDTYSLKVFAPNFLIAVILVNFSWVINMMVLDVGNVAYEAVLNAIQGHTEGFGLDNLAMTDQHMNLNYWNKKAGSKISSGDVFLSLILTFFLLFVVVFFLVKLLFTFFVRNIVIWLLMIIAPMAWVLFAVPDAKSYWSKYWNALTTMAFMPTVVAFFISVGIKVREQILVINTGKVAPIGPEENLMNQAANDLGSSLGAGGRLSFWQIILVYGIVVACLKLAADYGMNNEFTAAGTAMGEKLVGTAKSGLRKGWNATGGKAIGAAKETAGRKLKKSWTQFRARDEKAGVDLKAGESFKKSKDLWKEGDIGKKAKALQFALGGTVRGIGQAALTPSNLTSRGINKFATWSAADKAKDEKVIGNYEDNIAANVNAKHIKIHEDIALGNALDHIRKVEGKNSALALNVELQERKAQIDLIEKGIKRGTHTEADLEKAKTALTHKKEDILDRGMEGDMVGFHRRQATTIGTMQDAKDEKAFRESLTGFSDNQILKQYENLMRAINEKKTRGERAKMVKQNKFLLKGYEAELAQKGSREYARKKMMRNWSNDEMIKYDDIIYEDDAANANARLKEVNDRARQSFQKTNFEYTLQRHGISPGDVDAVANFTKDKELKMIKKYEEAMKAKEDGDLKKHNELLDGISFADKEFTKAYIGWLKEKGHQLSRKKGGPQTLEQIYSLDFAGNKLDVKGLNNRADALAFLTDETGKDKRKIIALTHNRLVSSISAGAPMPIWKSEETIDPKTGKTVYNIGRDMKYDPSEILEGYTGASEKVKKEMARDVLNMFEKFDFKKLEEVVDHDMYEEYLKIIAEQGKYLLKETESGKRLNKIQNTLGTIIKNPQFYTKNLGSAKYINRAKDNDGLFKQIVEIKEEVKGKKLRDDIDDLNKEIRTVNGKLRKKVNERDRIVASISKERDEIFKANLENRLEGIDEEIKVLEKEEGTLKKKKDGLEEEAAK